MQSLAGNQAEARPAPRFNRKVADPSRLMLPPDGHRYRCPWIEDSITLHSDGNVTCGVDDPHGQRSFGSINRQSVAEIFANPEYEKLRRKLWEGHRCTECDLYHRVSEADMPARPPLPTTMVVETTVRCNIRCAQPACIINNDPSLRTRDADMLGLAPFRRAVDELSPNLRHVYFFNYGDPFVHAQAEDMLAHLHRSNPDLDSITSTNGIPLAKIERARKVVQSGIRLMVFTIGGITQESYARYHAGGRVDLALRGMFNVLQARRELGMSTPVVHWRYLLFPWNDSDAEVEAARRMAEEHGVDEFHLYLTHVPQGAISVRFSPGSPNFARYRPYMNNTNGYTQVVPEPDANGFYEPEQTLLGPARWTGWQARKRLRVERHRARIAVTTNRPPATGRTDHVFLVTPWQKVKVPLDHEVWREVELAIPDHLQVDTIEVELVTFDHWFPAEETGSADPRCLGVLVREEWGEVREGWAEAQLWRGAVPATLVERLRLAGFRYRARGPNAMTAVPDENGFHGLERTALGPARWTGPWARRRLSVEANRARLTLTTSRPGASERTSHVFLITRWQTLKVPLVPMAWRSIELTVPGHLRLDELEVELVTFDDWSPAQELSVDDPRRLGVLVQEAETDPPWKGHAPLTEEEAAQLAGFCYVAPPRLVDGYAGRNIGFGKSERGGP